MDRSGAMVTSFARIGPGATIHRSGADNSTWTPPRSRSIEMVMSMLGRLGTVVAPPRCRMSIPLRYRAPASSNPEMYWLEVEASTISGPPATSPRCR